MEKIIIYTMVTCPYCKTIKEKLTENNIEFEEKINTEHKEEWQSVIDLTRIPMTPTIYYKNNYFVPNRDFGNPDGLINLLNEFKESEFSLTHRNNEALKSLNYQVLQALMQMNQTLKQIETKLNTNEHKSTD